MKLLKHPLSKMLRGKMLYRVALLLFFLMLPLAGITQVQMTLQEPPVKRLTPDDLWNLQLNNPRNINRNVYLIAEIQKAESGERVARFRTNTFKLPTGLQRLDPQRIKVTQKDFFAPRAERIIQQTNNFPKGTYKIHLTLYSATDESELSASTLEHDVVNIYTSAKKVVAGGDESFLSFYGNGYIEARNASRQATGQGIPQDYFRGRMNATLEIGMAPIQFHGYYTSVQSNLRQNPNSVTVSFDDQRFINNLRNQLTRVIEKETGMKKEEYTSAVNKLKKLDNIDRLLKNQDIDEQLREVGDLESIKNKLNDVDLQNAVNRIKGLKSDIQGRLEELDYKSRKAKIQTQLEVHKQVSYQDGQREQQRQATIDSLQNALQDLEKEKKQVKQQNRQDVQALKKLQQTQDKYQELKRKKEKIENLLDKKDRLKKLAKKKAGLQKFKEKLEESGGLEAIQSFNLSKLNNKQVLKNQLLKRGMLSGGEKLLYSIEELSAGTVYPYYSPLVLNGLRMTGVNFEWNPGIFYTAFSGGTSNEPRFSLENGVVDYKQRLLAGKIGLGKKNQTHIYLTALNAIDDRNSLARNDTISAPKSNFILGTDLGLTLFNGNVNIQGEVAGSKYDNDTEASSLGINNEFNQQVPDFLQPNISTRLGLAYDVRGSVKMFKSRTVVSGFLRNIDPSYNSFGAPNLRTGIFTYNIQFSQKLFSRNLTASLFRKNESTTRLWQDGLTHYERQGGELAMNFTSFPNMKISYAESVQDKGTINNDMSELMITGSHGYSIGELSLSNSFSYNLNQGQSTQSNGPDYKVTNYLFNQMVSFSFPLSLSLNLNYVDEVLQGTESEMLVSDLSASFQLFKEVNVNMGGVFKSRSNRSQKFGGFVDVNYSFARYFTFRLSLEQNYYDDLIIPANDFDEYILNSRLSMSW